MKNIKLLFCGLPLILLSCNSKVNMEQSSILDVKHIDMTNFEEMPDISLMDKYITDVKLIKLETNENGFIKGINDAIITDDRIFILMAIILIIISVR